MIKINISVRNAVAFSFRAVLIPLLFLYYSSHYRAEAAIYTVTSTADSGAGTLRQAITDANGSPGLDTITFNISGSGVHTISPSSALPSITDPVIIDGTSQPSF